MGEGREGERTGAEEEEEEEFGINKCARRWGPMRADLCVHDRYKPCGCGMEDKRKRKIREAP